MHLDGVLVGTDRFSFGALSGNNASSVGALPGPLCDAPDLIGLTDAEWAGDIEVTSFRNQVTAEVAA